ncbi:MAG: Fic family protein [Acutalibacteraceae bacterium]
MRNYDFDNWKTLLTPDIVSLLTTIHEFKGEQALFVEAKADILTSLLDIAKIQSAESSNKIEGIYTSDERLKKIVQNKTMPQSRSEQEIAGYRDVLATIHENYDYIPVKPSYILQLHRDLYKFSGKTIGGSYKTGDNVIAEEDSSGNRFIRFEPVAAWETQSSVEALCNAFDRELAKGDADPLILIPMFILDFLCIHPFNDGNGRISRLLTLLLLYRSGYIVGKYISIERIIEQSKETYYEALQSSSSAWHNNQNDYTPFVRYMLGVIAAAYREFSSRVKILSAGSKPDRIRNIIKGTLGKITKAEISEQCPDISGVTIQRTLNDLLKSGEIIKIGGGRYTSYTWNREND